LRLGAFALVAGSVVFAMLARQTDIGATRAIAPVVVQSVDLTFADRSDGAIVVRNGAGQDERVLPAGQDGFVRTALRSLAYERRTLGVSAAPQFRLGRSADGRLYLQDPATGRILHLDAFGQGNALSFAQFLEPRRATP
jgi:putative photosynthetic complex assembly protein